jgi:hypothetical protein
MGAADLRPNTNYNTHERLNQLERDCVEAREGVGKNGDWAVDFHQRFDLSEAIRGCDLIKDLAPLFSKNRDRLLEGDIAEKFFAQVLNQAREADSRMSAL